MTYYDCPEHGHQDHTTHAVVHAYGCGQPVTVSTEVGPFGGQLTTYRCTMHGELSGYLSTVDVFLCQCGQRCKRREVAIRTPRGAKPGKCGSACLNGKKSCDCECHGICHGAKECRCGVAV